MTPRMLAVSLLSVSLAAVRVGAADDVVALVGGRIVPVSGPPIERGTLVMAAGKIEALGAAVVPPVGARIVDVSGQVVYPGLIDALTHIGLVEISAVVASNDTREMGDLNPQAQAWIALNAHSEAIPVARANGLTAVLSAPDGGLVSGQSAFIHLTGTTPDALTLKTPAALHMVYPSGEPGPEGGPGEVTEPKTFEERLKDRQKNQEKELRRLANLLEEARAYGRALDAARAGTLPAPKPDLTMAALVLAARGELPVVMRAEREADIRGAVTFAEQQHLTLIVAGGLEAWRCAELLHSKDVPVLLSVLRLPARESDDYDAAYANAATLHAASVRFAIVTDDSPANARNLPYHAAMARAFGLPADVALRAITLAPAEIFGLGARLGSLAVGKDADVTVASGDIMDARSQVTHVFIAGQEQSLESRHTRLYKAFKDRP